MDNNLVLENIKAIQARLAAILKKDFPRVYTLVEQIEAMDLTPFIDEVETSLTEAFEWWAKETEPDSMIGNVLFEYSDTKDDAVYAYGYEDAVIKQSSSRSLEGLVEIDYGQEVFYDSLGFEIFGFRDKTKGINGATEGSDYETAKMAEILFYAMEKAILSDHFLKLPKADQVTFTLCRHNRWEIISYVWRKI
jgi:hypothetical protein